MRGQIASDENVRTYAGLDRRTRGPGVAMPSGETLELEVPYISMGSGNRSESMRIPVAELTEA